MKEYQSWGTLESYLSEITRQVAVDGFSPDVVLGPGRGGYPIGVMLSHYFEVPFHGFEWTTRDHGMIKESTRLETILSKYNSNNVLIVDDINDSGETLTAIDEVVSAYDKEENNNTFFLHDCIKYATLYDKESSKFSKVSYAGKIVTPEEERWIVFPYEEWWK
tara:strand:+ start:426 stop:914 length:489 start_codon:yes stop_codon:yes gene_type:complete